MTKSLGGAKVKKRKTNSRNKYSSERVELGHREARNNLREYTINGKYTLRVIRSGNSAQHVIGAFDVNILYFLSWSRDLVISTLKG